MKPGYRPYHPKWYRPRMPIFWWLRKLAYTKFVLRELTSLAVAYTAVLLLIHAVVAARGGDAYQGFLGWLESPPVVMLHGVVFLGLLFHTVTWLNLAPKAMFIRLGGRRLPDAVIVLGHYLAWLATSAVLAWLLVGTP